MTHPKKTLQGIISVCALILFSFIGIHGQGNLESIILEDLRDEYNFNDKLYILEDDACSFSIDQVKTSEEFQSFISNDSNNKLDPTSCYWIHFNLQSASDFFHYFENWKLFLGEADFISVYVLDQNGEIINNISTGNWYPLSLKAETLNHKIQRVNLSFEATDPIQFFIKYHKEDHQPYKIDVRFKKYDFHQSASYLYSTKQNWLFLGFVLTMLLSNFIFFFTTRFKGFLYHGLFILGIVMFTFDIFGITDNLFFIKDHPSLVQLFSVLGVALADIAYFQFIRHYLMLNFTMPKWDTVLFRLVLLKLAFWPLVLIYYYTSYNEPITDKLILSFLAIQFLIAGIFLIYILRLKQKNNLYLILGSGFLILLIIVNAILIFTSTGISSIYTQLGIVGEILCFTLGLSFRFNNLREEKENNLRLKELSIKLELKRLVKEKTKSLRKEKKRTESLLHNILPIEVAKELMETGTTKPARFDEVSILFSDFKNFTNIVATIPTNKLIAELNELYSQFDDIMEFEGVEKIQTVGDSYLAAAGLPTEAADHALRCVRAGKK